LWLSRKLIFKNEGSIQAEQQKIRISVRESRRLFFLRIICSLFLGTMNIIWLSELIEEFIPDFKKSELNQMNTKANYSMESNESNYSNGIGIHSYLNYLALQKMISNPTDIYSNNSSRLIHKLLNSFPRKNLERLNKKFQIFQFHWNLW
jgi:hypothetical protein